MVPAATWTDQAREQQEEKQRSLVQDKTAMVAGAQFLHVSDAFAVLQRVFPASFIT